MSEEKWENMRRVKTIHNTLGVESHRWKAKGVERKYLKLPKGKRVRFNTAWFYSGFTFHPSDRKAVNKGLKNAKMKLAKKKGVI